MIILYAIISCDQPLFTLYFLVWEILRGFYSPFHSLSLYPFHLSLAINLCLRFISWFGRFYEDFTLPFTLSIPFTLSLSLSPFLSLLSLPLSLFLSFYLSFSLSPSLSLLSIILFGVSNGRFRPCFSITIELNRISLFFFSSHWHENIVFSRQFVDL